MLAGSWETRYSTRGTAYQILVRPKEEGLARISDVFLNCVIYLYPSPEEANAGSMFGGTGCIVGIPSLRFPAYTHLYAVSNAHVVNDSPVVRLNTRDGKVDIFDQLTWINPSGKDVSVASIALQRDVHEAAYVNVGKQFLTADRIEKYDVGIGDEVFTVGRFVQQDGRLTNQPSGRFGNLSMMPGELIQTDSGHRQAVFTIEGTLTEGYSGSPVFVDILPFHPRAKTKTVSQVRSVFFLGIVCGYLPQWQPLATRKAEGKFETKDDQKLGVVAHPNMTAVVPAWDIVEVLGTPELKMKRQADEQVLSENKRASSVIIETRRKRPAKKSRR